jgi:aspartate aminotransferase
MSIFNSVEMRPDDPILGLSLAFAEDPRAQKVNLGVGAYKNAEGKPQVFSCVHKAEKILLEKNLNKEYPPILGNPDFIRESLQLIYGKNSSALAAGSICAAQTLGGTGALRIGGDFLTANQLCSTIYLSDPTWPNHITIFLRAGMKVDTFTYYDMNNNVLNFTGMRQSLEKAPPGSVVLLQPCCHNPTGLSPSTEQWEQVSQLMKHHKLIPFFDLAYQGFDQDLDEDAAVVRRFAEAGHEMLVAYSFSKNLGLYGERTGLLSVVCNNSDNALRVQSQLKQIIRASYSMPPLQGQRIATTVLQSNELRQEWVHELQNVRHRIQEVRKIFLSSLQAASGDAFFDFLSNQKGMFSFSGLNREQVTQLKQKYGIYMPLNGRLNITGINMANKDYVVKSILSVI